MSTSFHTPSVRFAALASLAALLATALVVVAPGAPRAHAASYTAANNLQFGLAIAAFSADCDDTPPNELVITANIDITLGADATYVCNEDLTIRSSDGNHFTISGAGVNNRRFLNATGSGATITIEDLTIEDFGGPGVDFGGAIAAPGSEVVVLNSTFADNEAGEGGAISTSTAAGHVRVVNSSFERNVAEDGGAIRTFSASILADYSEFIDNYAADYGGALYGGSTGSFITVDSSLFENNEADFAGGAIHAMNSGVDVYNSVFLNNDGANTGGAISSIANSGSGIWSVNSLFHGNVAIGGGAISTAGTAGDIYLGFSTVSNNSATQVRALGSGQVLGTQNSVFAAPQGGANCSGGLSASGGYNHATDSSCWPSSFTGDVTSGNPMLGPVADNGGHLPSRRPLPGSPLIDSIPTSVSSCGIASYLDLRGVPRPQGGACDKGAVETFSEFSDVSDTAPAHPFMVEISWLVKYEVAGGYPDGTFRPTATVSRQAVSAFFYRYRGEPVFTPPGTASFTDVPTSHPFRKEIEWMVELDITQGYGDGTFRPTNGVSRMATAAFLYRLDGQPVYTPPGVATFSDVSNSHPFYKEIEWLNSTGITGGYSDGTFRPGSTVSRQAIGAFLYRYNDYE